MTKPTLLAIAAFAAAIANTAKELAGNTTGDAPAESPAEPTTKRRGRPANTENTTPTEEKPAAAPAGVKTENELREICAPLIHAGRGEEVKVLLAKYKGTKFADLPVENHTAFLRDVEALLM